MKEPLEVIQAAVYGGGGDGLVAFVQHFSF